MKNSKKLGINKDNSLEDRDPSIRFKRKRIKSNIRVGRRLLLNLLLVGVFAVFFSSITIKVKYGEIVDLVKQYEENKEYITFNYKDIIKVVSPSLVSISSDSEKLTSNTYYSENSTGVIISEDGLILTNFSKVKDLENLYVKLPANGVLPINAEFIEGDEEIDIAIIKIKYDGILTPIKFSGAEDTIVGSNIAILSNSVGDDYIGSIIPGIITSMNKEYIDSKSSKKYKLLETSAFINSENTGGAVVNSKGELVGIASIDITTKNKQEGLFYAVGVSELEEIINSSTTFKSLLGLTGGSIVDEDHSISKGFYVESVKKGGNAYNAGIKPTDIFLEVDDVEVMELEVLEKVLKNKKSGDVLNCKILRSGNVKDIEIVLDEF